MQEILFANNIKLVSKERTISYLQEGNTDFDQKRSKNGKKKILRDWKAESCAESQSP